MFIPLFEEETWKVIPKMKKYCLDNNNISDVFRFWACIMTKLKKRPLRPKILKNHT